MLSAAEVRAWAPEKKDAWVAGLSPEDALAVLYHWPFWARPDQMEPEDTQHSTWLICGGRGSGKSRSACQWDIDRAREGPHIRMALIAPTAADCRDVIVEGESGILACSPPDFMPTYHPSKRLVLWPNGARAFCYSAEEPDRLRGPQHHYGHCEEMASWDYPDAWSNFQFGLRLGQRPRAVVATTPKPVRLIRELLADPYCATTRATTYDNLAYLAPTFRRTIVEKYEGTRLGRQELMAEMLDDVPGALWTRGLLDERRVKAHPELRRLVIGIDPATTARKGPGEDASCHTGIVACGLAEDAERYYVLEDISQHDKPHVWAMAAVRLYHELCADAIVAETNQGGDMVEAVVRQAERHLAEDAARAGRPAPMPVRYIGVHASVGKRLRAEPIAGLYERGLVHHLPGLADLEDQQCTWDPMSTRASPDRLDACVHALAELHRHGQRGHGGALVQASPLRHTADDDYDEDY